MKIISPNLKIFIISCIIVLVVSGCAAKKTVPAVNKRMLMQGEESTATKGDIFFSASPGNNVPGDKNEKFSLSILKLYEREIVFKYINTTDAASSGGAKKPVNTFTYPVNEKRIRFREFEFQILPAGEKEIRYKRIK